MRSLSGPTQGKAGMSYDYSFSAVDPDNNPISFYLDWGDGNEGWTREYASCESTLYDHTWEGEGTYTIRVKAKDVLGEESDWKYLKVTMPMDKQNIQNTFLTRLLEQFPRLFPILRTIILQRT
jgi:hypothetical protein